MPRTPRVRGRHSTCQKCLRTTEAASGICRPCRGITPAALTGGKWILRPGGVWIYRRQAVG